MITVKWKHFNIVCNCLFSSRIVFVCNCTKCIYFIFPSSQVLTLDYKYIFCDEQPRSEMYIALWRLRLLTVFIVRSRLCYYCYLFILIQNKAINIKYVKLNKNEFLKLNIFIDYIPSYFQCIERRVLVRTWISSGVHSNISNEISTNISGWCQTS